MRGRLTELNGYQAIERGPVVLARDTRLGEGLSMKPASCKRVADMCELMPVTDKPAGVWMAFSAPMKLRDRYRRTRCRNCAGAAVRFRFCREYLAFCGTLPGLAP
ncbi:MAG: hypothetical protein ACLR8Y_02525 [Alistipes indistinctus]